MVSFVFEIGWVQWVIDGRSSKDGRRNHEEYYCEKEAIGLPQLSKVHKMFTI